MTAFLLAALAFAAGFLCGRRTFPWDDRREAAGQDYRDGYVDGRRAARSTERYQ